MITSKRNLLSIILIFTMAAAADLSTTDHFTRSFYNEIKSTSGNIFFSPLSIETILQLTFLGSGGSTANQLQTTLKLPDRNAVLRQAKSVGTLLKSTEDVILDVANGLFGNEGFPILPEYITTAKEYFDAEIKSVPFANSEAALNVINSWVDEKTNHKIPTLLQPGSVDGNTALVLVNAIYFKGKWTNQFPARSTKPGPFYLNEQDSVNVDFMTQKANFRVAQNEDLNSYIVELPYVGGDISMFLIVPKEKTGLKLVEEKLPDLNLAKLTTDLAKREIILTLPKFKIEQTIDLEDHLKNLGITDLFSETNCDLKGISSQPLYVSKAVQKSFIEVNEEGSEAAAATGIKVSMRMMPLPPIAITADSPFLFLIRHSSGAFLFAGRLSYFA